jgi:hypothetical protein
MSLYVFQLVFTGASAVGPSTQNVDVLFACMFTNPVIVATGALSKTAEVNSITPFPNKSLAIVVVMLKSNVLQTAFHTVPAVIMVVLRVYPIVWQRAPFVTSRAVPQFLERRQNIVSHRHFWRIDLHRGKFNRFDVYHYFQITICASVQPCDSVSL